MNLLGGILLGLMCVACGIGGYFTGKKAGVEETEKDYEEYLANMENKDGNG